VRSPELQSGILVVGALLAASCSMTDGDEQPVTSPAVADYSDGFDQSDAVAVLQMCDAPKGVLWVDDRGDVRFEPPLTMEYEAASCVLKEIKASGTTKFGFVGNERYVAGESE